MLTQEPRYLIFLAEPPREPALPLLWLAAHIGQIGGWRPALRTIQLHGPSRATIHLLRLCLHGHAVVSGIDLPRTRNLRLLARLLARWVAIGRIAIGWISVPLRVAILPSIRVLIWVVAVALLLHDRAVVAVLRVLAVSIHWSLRLSRCHSVERAVLAAGIGAVGPRPSAIRSVRHAGVDCIVGLVVAVLRIWFWLSIHLRVGLHAVPISQTTWWTAAIASIPTLVSVVSTAGPRMLAVWHWAVAVACYTVGL